MPHCPRCGLRSLNADGSCYLCATDPPEPSREKRIDAALLLAAQGESNGKGRQRTYVDKSAHIGTCADCARRGDLYLVWGALGKRWVCSDCQQVVEWLALVEKGEEVPH